MKHAVLYAALMLGALNAAPPHDAAPLGARRAKSRATASKQISKAIDGVVLHETHETGGWSGVDTIVTYITPSRVRISYATGDAILDVGAGRFTLLDRTSSTYRSMTLRDWESRLAATESLPAAAGDSAARPAPDAQFELEGEGGEVAGYRCDRYHLYARRELLPGEVDMIEQEIWVTRELELPGTAYDTYRRAVENLERLGLDPRIRRPPGVAMQVYTRTRPQDGAPLDDEVERSIVVRVEKRPLALELFQIPSHYRPDSDSTATGR